MNVQYQQGVITTRAKEDSWLSNCLTTAVILSQNMFFFPKTFASAFGAFIVKVWEDVACLITAYVTSLTDNRRGSKWVSVVFTGREVQMWHLRGGQLGRLGVIRGCRGNNEHRNTKDQLFLMRFIFPSYIIHLSYICTKLPQLNLQIKWPCMESPHPRWRDCSDIAASGSEGSRKGET